MRVEIYGSFGPNGEVKTVDLDDNLQGVTSFGELHSGQYRVDKIHNVRIYEDRISICVSLIEGDKNADKSDPVAELAAMEHAGESDAHPAGESHA